nr:hypothetical protein [Tanacetum cinerariifolium]
MTLTFVDTHSMVAYLSKSDASEGLDQIIDFINGSYIAYALTVSPTIYVSCIKQFWRTVFVKSSNDVTRLQALVDKKRVVVSEVVIRDALHLDGAEGVDCLPNEEIFTELVGKDCLGVETTLFEGMLVAREHEEQGDVEEQGSEEEQGNADTTAEEPKTTVPEDAANDQPIPSPTTLTQPPQKSQDGRQADIYHIDMDHATKVLSMQEDESEVQEAVKVDTNAKLIIEVIAAVSEIVSVAAVIPSVVPETISAAAITTITAPPIKVSAPVKAEVSSTRRKRGEAIWDPEEESSAKTPTETTSKDKGKGILVKEPKPIKKKQQVEMDEAYQVMKKRPQTEAQARRNMMMYLKNTVGFTLDYFKGMSYDDIRPIFVAKFNANIEFLLKSKEQIEEKEESRAISTINETLAQKAAKRRKLIKEAKEAESIKQHLQIVTNEDDDVFTQATPLARKVPVVDYQIILVNNKPRYKIIKADDTHQLYASFITMLKNFNREDLETLWRIVKEREPEEQGDVEEQGNEEEQGTADTTTEEPKITILEDAANDQPIPSPTPFTPHHNNLKMYHQHPMPNPLHYNHTLQLQLKHKVAQDLKIIKLNTRVKKLEKTNKAKTLKLRRLRKVGTSQRVDTFDDTLMEDVSNQERVIDRDEDAVKETKAIREYTADTQVEGRQADIYHIDMDHATKVLSMQEDESEVQEAVEVVTTAKLITEVIVAVSETVSAAAVIPSVVPETINAAAIPTVTAPPIKVVAPVKAVVASTRRKREVVIWDPKEESSAKTPTETTSKDKGKGILVEEPKPMKKKQQVKLDEAYARKLQEEFNQDIDWEAAIDHETLIQRYQVMKKRPQTEAQARRNMMMYLKNTTGFTLDYFKGMSYDDIRPIFVAKFNVNMEFLLKSKEQIEEEESRAIAIINETPAQKATKKRKLIEEAKEAESIKHHLQIVPDEDDDVLTEATPLSRKLYASFITIQKNFDREDLETLWRIVKERLSTSKPNNFLDEYLLTALETMFERPDGQDNVWRNQSTVHGQAVVKSWKLLTSCGVHIISFNTTQIILLVERRYPLTKFTLEQMLNVVRLQVEEESEMSMELIRFTRQQLQEAHHN